MSSSLLLPASCSRRKSDSTFGLFGHEGLRFDPLCFAGRIEKIKIRYSNCGP